MVIKKEKIIKILKKVLLVLFVFYLGAVIGYNFFYWLHKKTREIEIKKGEEVMRQFYLKDTYGGKTPQETVDLFILALKNQDIDLAVKYVKESERKNAKNKLEEIIKNKNLDKAIEKLSFLQQRETTIPDYYAEFVLIDSDNIVIYSVSLEKNKYNNLWKITDF